MPAASALTLKMMFMRPSEKQRVHFVPGSITRVCAKLPLLSNAVGLLLAVPLLSSAVVLLLAVPWLRACKHRSRAMTTALLLMVYIIRSRI